MSPSERVLVGAKRPGFFVIGSCKFLFSPRARTHAALSLRSQQVVEPQREWLRHKKGSTTERCSSFNTHLRFTGQPGGGAPSPPVTPYNPRRTGIALKHTIPGLWAKFRLGRDSPTDKFRHWTVLGCPTQASRGEEDVVEPRAGCFEAALPTLRRYCRK